jgi:hypothetical protein
MDRSQVSRDPFRYNLGVNITFPGLGTYDHCYVLSGDYFGPRWVYYDPPAQAQLTVPEHMVSALVRLSQEPQYEYSLMSSSVLCRGKAGKFKLRVQHLDPGSKQYAIRIETPFGGQNYNFSLGPYDVQEIQYNFLVPSTYELGEDTFWVIDTFPTPDDSTLFTLWVYDPVSIELPEILFIKFPVGDSFPLTLTNNTPDTMSVTLSGIFEQGHGEIEFIGSNPDSIPGYTTEQIAIFVENKDSIGTLNVIAISNSDTVGNIAKQITRAMRPSPGDLFFDDFNSGSMSSQWDTSYSPNAWSVEDSSAKGSGTFPQYLATVGAGDLTWTDYCFQLNTMLSGSTQPNIPYLKSYIFCRLQNDTMYYRYGIKGDENNVVLYRREGQSSWARRGSYPLQSQKNLWYYLAMEVDGDSIHCYLNGQRVISVKDTVYSNGGIGMGITEDYMTNYYDDVVVRPHPLPDTLFFDNFNSGAMNALWNKTYGTWTVPPEEPGFARGSGIKHFATVAEGCDWTNYQYQLKTRIKGSDFSLSLRSYLFFRIQDEDNLYRFGLCSDSGVILHKRVNGTWTTLDNDPLLLQKNVWYNLKITIESDTIKGYLNDSLRINYIDGSNPFLNGGIGIGVLQQESIVTDYDDVVVQPLPLP